MIGSWHELIASATQVSVSEVFGELVELVARLLLVQHPCEEGSGLCSVDGGVGQVAEDTLVGSDLICLADGEDCGEQLD